MTQGKNTNHPTRTPERRIKVFGERNTGTRAVVHMLRAHEGVSLRFPSYKSPELDALEARIHQTMKGFRRELFVDALEDIRRSKLSGHSAWKHAAPVVDESYAAKEASVLFLVRDPYSWITSLFRHPYHARAPRPDTLEAFLEQPWLTLKRDNIAPMLLSPMQLWNEKLRAYHAFACAAPVPSTVLHFEDFVLAPVAALSNALAKFSIPAKGLKELDAPTKKRGVDRAARLKYYKTKAWEQEISVDAARLINTYVDWDVASIFGYSRRDPDDFKDAPTAKTSKLLKLARIMAE